MRKLSTAIVLASMLVFAVPALAQEPGATVGDTATGLVTVESNYGFEETYDRLRGAIEQNGQLSIVAEVDHAANAQSVGKDLGPTRLLIFGNPDLGTELMQAEQTVGIDLPQKFLVYENAEGQVLVTYNDPYYLAGRHGIEGQDGELQKIFMALSNLAGTATGTGQQGAQQMPDTGGIPPATVLLGGTALLVAGGLLVRRLR